MTDVTPPVLAISPENDSAHIGAPDIVLGHVEAERPKPEDGRRIIDWEFFDAAGNPLAVSDDGAGNRVLVVADDGAPAPDRAARQQLVTRIGIALDNAQLRLDQKLALAGGAGPDGRVEVVKVAGELADVLVMLGALEDLEIPAPQPHPGSWLHNLLDGAFGR